MEAKVTIEGQVTLCWFGYFKGKSCTLIDGFDLSLKNRSIVWKLKGVRVDEVKGFLGRVHLVDSKTSSNTIRGFRAVSIEQ